MIETTVNGSLCKLRVTGQAGEGSLHYYNYYALTTLDGGAKLKINLEEQDYTIISGTRLEDKQEVSFKAEDRGMALLKKAKQAKKEQDGTVDIARTDTFSFVHKTQHLA